MESAAAPTEAETAAEPRSQIRRGALSPRSRRIVSALARAAMPAGKTLPAPDDRVADRIDDFLDGSPPLVRLGLKAMLWVLELGAILFHLRPFSRLPDEAALRYLERFSGARAFIPRTLLRGVLTPVKMAFYAQPEVSRLLGFDPPPPPRNETPGPWFSRVGAAADHAGTTLTCQVVVVGSGPGGAVMATRLAEKGVDVLVLEEGRYHLRSEFTRRPLEMMTRMYRDGGTTVALGIPGIPIPLGKTVGGTSTVNSGTCFRVPERKLETWREDFGLESYTAELLAPHYDELEAFLHVGPVPESVYGNVPKIIARGCEALGYSHGPLHRNATGCQGSGVCCFGCPTGAKQSMNLSYVPRALTAGARLLTGARVLRVVREGGVATGVVARTAGGGEVTVKADAVVVACGTVFTPLLLMNSRIGGGSGALGNNMTIHPAAKCAGLFDEHVRGWEGVPQGYCIDEFKEEGIVFEGASVPPEAGAVAIPHIGPRFTELMEAYDQVAFFGYLVEDAGRGKVRRDPGGRARLSYRLGKEELGRLKRGAEILAEVLFAAGAHTVLSPVAGLEELARGEAHRLRSDRIRGSDFELTAFHPLGTCRMSADPKTGVLDPRCEVWDTDRLFVTDGSVFPTSLGVNPQMTIMAVTSLVADHVAARLGGAARHGR